MSVRSAKENRRYHLHRKIRRAKYHFLPNKKLVYVPTNIDLQNKDVIELRDNYNYSIQLQIPIAENNTPNIKRDYMPESLQNEDLAGWAELGIYFGYPSCCIDHFCNNIGNQTESQVIASRRLGFLPCPDHSDKINAGKITLESLIVDRFCKKPFPQEDTGWKTFKL